MIDPSWLADILAGLVLAVALYCAGRIGISLVRGRHVELDTDLTHILMGIGMAGMFVSRLAILDTTLWATVFGVVAVWFIFRIVLEVGHDGGQLAGLRHHAGHVISALAMLYMFLAVPSASASSASGTMGDSGMGSMGSMGSDMGGGSGMGAHVPSLALLFALLLFGYVVLVADRIPLVGAAVSEAVPVDDVSGGPARGQGLGIGSGTLLAPRTSAVCEVVMSIAMGVMLIAML